MRVLFILGLAGSLSLAAGAATPGPFRDDFRPRLDSAWSWKRENPSAWRLTSHGLEVRIEPGNMWGPENNARNVLTRPVLEPADKGIEARVTVENRPTNQYEQVDLVWYYDDSHMVKIGQELVDGKLCIVMGREEADRTRTIAIIPIEHFRVELRLRVRGLEIQGHFRAPGTAEWREAGRCNLPAKGEPKIALQCYQGPSDAEHWARLTDFAVTNW